LDNYTFDQFLAIPGYSVLVKFDQPYAYGDKEDEFKTVCKLAYEVPQFFVAEVPVQEYGDKENDDLRQRFGLKKEDFPAYYLFNSANSEGLKFAGDVKVDDITLWLRRNQIKLPLVGTIGELDQVAQKFLKDGLAEEHLAKAKDLAAGQFSADRKAAVYVKVMEKVKEKGEGYLAAETERVNKILSGHVTAEKKAELTDKIRVLNAFTRDEL